MMNRFGLDRFKKAQSAEPFSVKAANAIQPSLPQPYFQPPAPKLPPQQAPTAKPSEAEPSLPPAPPTTTVGGGASTWQPPDWAVDPKPGVYWLEVMKDGEVVDKIPLDKRRCIFGRQNVMCDLVLDHPSVSRQHAAVVQHKNNSIYVIDLGSVHGTFVANERLTKDNPLELEIGQSLRFAASTRVYVLRKSVPAPPAPAQLPPDLALPPPPDASDEDAVVVYNTALNRLGVASSSTSLITSTNVVRKPGSSVVPVEGNREESSERPSKKARKSRVSFRDEYGGVLVEVVGISDGADVSTEPGPIGVREGSLVGKYESLVQVTVIPRGQEDSKQKLETGASQGVTQRLQQYLDKVKSPGKSGLYGDLYGESVLGTGGSWASVRKTVDGSTDQEDAVSVSDSFKEKLPNGGLVDRAKSGVASANDSSKDRIDASYNDDDLFGEEDEMPVLSDSNVNSRT